jgi:hypothetical protein
VAIRKKTQLLLAIFVAHLSLLASSAIAAGGTKSTAGNLTIQFSPPNLGTVAAAAYNPETSTNGGVTLFPIGTSGSLGTITGGGSKTSATSPAAASITVVCAANAACQNTAVSVKISASTLSGRAASISNFVATATDPRTLATVSGSGASQVTLKFSSGLSSSKDTKNSSAVRISVGATFGVAGDTTSSTNTGSWTFNVDAGDGTEDSGPIPVTMTATVDYGLSITNVIPLNFGGFAASAIGGTVTYPAGGGAMTLPSDIISLPDTAAGAPHLGSVHVNGGAGTIVTVNATTTPLSGPGGSLNLTASVAPGGSLGLLATSGGLGSRTYTIGGSFTLPANEKPGSYSGGYTVTASYN